MRGNVVLLFVSCLAFAPSDAQGRGKPVDPVTLPKDVAATPVDAAGMVVGTLGYRTDNKPYVGSAALLFRRAGSTETGAIQYTRATAKLRGDADVLGARKGDFHYVAFSMSLPEGQYELLGVLASYGMLAQGDALAASRFQQSVKTGRDGSARSFGAARVGGPVEVLCAAGTSTDVMASDAFSVPFEVKRGRVLYLGSFLAHGTLNKGKACFIPMPMPDLVYLSHADKWERDRSVLQAAETAFDPALVDRAVLGINERTGYYLIAEDHVPEPKWKMRDYSSGRMNLEGKIAAYQALHPAVAATGAPAQAPASEASAAAAAVDAAAPTATAPVDALAVDATTVAPAPAND